jgi:hypothetical protein
MAITETECALYCSRAERCEVLVVQWRSEARRRFKTADEEMHRAPEWARVERARAETVATLSDELSVVLAGGSND